jgi:hypothetical protein
MMKSVERDEARKVASTDDSNESSAEVESEDEEGVAEE